MGHGENGAKTPRKRLKLKDINGYFQRLAEIPKGAVLPDWSDLTIGNRFAIVLRFIRPPMREIVLGKSAKQITRYEEADVANPKSPPLPALVLAALAAETEIPIDWIVNGRSIERRPPMLTGTPEQLIAEGADVPLQKLIFRASAGHGTPVMDTSAEYVRFPRAILDRIGVKAMSARLMESAGESMRPTIEDRDTMVVDVSSTDIIEGKVYVFSIGGEIYVKRLRRVGDQIMMMSDNRELFPRDEAVPADQPFTIHGRVKWTGRSL